MLLQQDYFLEANSELGRNSVCNICGDGADLDIGHYSQAAGSAMTLDLAQLVSIYGIWIVAGFIALESIGLPVPAEAALIAAAFFAARSDTLNLWVLIATGISAAIGGDIVGFWIGRTFGCQLMVKYGGPQRVRIAKWLFFQYGAVFVFTARFLPFLRNMAAVLAGANCMSQYNFYFASATAAICWVVGYSVAAYSFGETFTSLASPAGISLSAASAFVMVGLPMIIVRCEKWLLAKIDCRT
jgi:membrane protein DedA with SNARE-associated domain